jgi:hypothetical protein
MPFLENPNSITFMTLSFGFLTMALTTILACCFRMKCSEFDCKCFKITRDIAGENIEIGIEGRQRGNNDDNV